MNMKNVEKRFEQIAKIAGWLWQNGWAEQNAGNISLQVTDEIDVNTNALGLFDFVEMEIPYENLENQVYIVSATGSRFRDIADDPRNGLLIVLISPSCGGYYIISHENVELRPSSEFISHLAMQSYFIDEGKHRRAILHTHPENLITLTHLPGMDNADAINNILWQMHTETPVFLNDGVGFASFQVPGSTALADASMALLPDHRIIIWEKHGALATANDLTQCFDLLDIAEKAAGIYLKAKSTGNEPTGLKRDNIHAIREFWGV